MDLEQIKTLFDLVNETDITEFEYESGEERITIRKPGPYVAAAAMQQMPMVIQQAAQPVHTHAVEPSATTTEAKAKVEDESSNGKGLIPITSPMVGTFYRAPSPTAPPFIGVGDLVAPGQTVCIIEAMKLMNDLPAEISGRIVKVCVESGTTVEYGQPLFMVNPKV